MKKKLIITILCIVLLIIIPVMIVICFLKKENSSTPNEQKNETIKDEIKDKLISLNYSKEDIILIQKYMSEENRKRIIENEYDPKIIINLVKEDYYIDDYLFTYYEYYQDNNYSIRDVIERVNTHVNYDYYTHIIPTDTSLGKYVILNKYYYADNTYPSENMITISGEYNLYGTSFKLNQECYEAFLKMYEDAKSNGYAFKINSAYRSYNSQEKLYNGYVAKDGVTLTDTYSARPGFSEHQTGYTFDIRDYPLTNDDYSKTKSFTWVSENAYKYGFIIRYPKDKEEITGYQYESWHYRYCGIECSTYIHKTGITFDEYYEYFIKYKNPKNLS